MATGRVSLRSALMLVALTFTAAAGCAGGAGGPEARPAQSLDLAALQLPAEFSAREISLEQALADLTALPVPAEADAQVFAQLKTEFAKVLLYYYGGDEQQQLARKQSSGLTPTQMSQPWCTTATVNAAGLVTVDWRGRHTGDYDLNGEVNISDITPLGIYFADTVEVDADGLPVIASDNEWKSQVDGDGNTELNIADLTPIGVNFSSRQLGLRVYYGLYDGSSIVWEPDFVPNPDDPAAVVSIPFNESTDPGAVLRYSFAFNRPPIVKPDQAFVQLVPFDGSAERSATILPLHAGPHAPMGCGICHKLTDYSFRGLDGACKTCHSTPPEDGQAAWTGAPGMHGDCLSCHDQHGFSITPPESVCADCHSDKVTAVAPSGMTACLGCHEQPHLPNAAPISTQCAACHSDKTATLADELMQECSLCHSAHTFSQTYTPQSCTSCHANPDGNAALQWADSPGMHGTCPVCHTTHDFKFAQPNSVCATCHQDKIDDNHSNGNLACLECHNSPHMPELLTGQAACLTCHPTPPNQPTKAWADAPGLHSTCEQCHNPATHGSKPTPPESICINCHSELMVQHAPVGTACADCHNAFYHVPDVTRGNAGCVLCHPVPPEDPTKAWLDAPGQHAQCTLCHPGNHPDKPVPPESVCLNCHQSTWEDKHTPEDTLCLDCHLWEHLPLGIDYTPGLHDGHDPGNGVDCVDCHTGHGGGGMPDRIDCLVCHVDQEAHSRGQECLVCHQG